MVTFPNAKINLGLNIISKRPDGYHNLESCFYPINWTDALEILPAEKLIFTSSGIPIPGKPEDNICLKAYEKIKADHEIPFVHIHLHKNIPIGAGLGGGSSDAAFTIKMLNKLFSLNLSDVQMEDYVRPIGSDCAFFIKNKPVFAYNKGDQFEELSISLSGKFIVLVYPEIHISTKEAYEGLTIEKPSLNLKDILAGKINKWTGQLKNDFEKSILLKYPSLHQLKQKFYESGAIYSSMTGSGSCVYALFEKEINLEGLFPQEFKVFSDFI